VSLGVQHPKRCFGFRTWAIGVVVFTKKQKRGKYPMGGGGAERFGEDIFLGGLIIYWKKRRVPAVGRIGGRGCEVRKALKGV